MLAWFKRWREARHENLEVELEDEIANEPELTEADRFDRRHDYLFQGGAGGSGRPTSYDEGHTHDDWSPD